MTLIFPYLNISRVSELFSLHLRLFLTHGVSILLSFTLVRSWLDHCNSFSGDALSSVYATCNVFKIL